MNKSINRFKKHLELFADRLKESVRQATTKKDAKLCTLLHANDGRTPMFQLQGLARIQAKSGSNQKIAATWLAEFKFIEDSLGKYDYWNAWLEKNGNWKFPEAVTSRIGKEAFFSAGVLEEGLLRSDWLEHTDGGLAYTDKALKRIYRSLEKAEFPSPGRERKELLKMFRDEAMEIHEKVRDKEIDLRLLEEGIHEFRRKTRWLGIYSSSLLGKVRLSAPVKGDPLSAYLTKENETFKFNQLPFKEDQKEPVFFLRGGFFAMSQLIAEIGDIKDPGLATEEMMRMGSLAGMTTAQVRKQLGADFYEHKKLVKDAGAVINRYLFKENLMVHIAEYFDRQL